jgi:hypothetical protein
LLLTVAIAALIGCVAAGRFVGVPGGTGGYVWEEHGTTVGRIRFWPHGEVTGDFAPFSEEGGTWSHGEAGLLVVTGGGREGERTVFGETEPDLYVALTGGAAVRLIPARMAKDEEEEE